MTLAEFNRQITKAVAQYLPQAKFHFTAQHGIRLNGRVQTSASTIIDVYFNARNGKTSYSLVEKGNRIFGYDNYRGWHRHPSENPAKHIACPEPSVDQVFGEIKAVLDSKPRGT